MAANSTLLNDQQRERALEAMREYLASTSQDGKPRVEGNAEWDKARVALIDKTLQALVGSFLDGSTALATFKSKIDSINKRNSLWGFKGAKGQMFFNLVVNVADDPTECDQEIKAAINVPTSEQLASSRIKTFASYVKRLDEQWVNAGNTRHGAPKVGSIAFFVSYFWQIQERDVWPVYYTSSVNTMTDLNLWQPTGDLAEDYLAYKHIHEELAELFAKDANRPFHLYDVEHVFWFKGGNPYDTVKPGGNGTSGTVTPSGGTTVVVGPVTQRLPESYVPPIVAILPRISRHEPALKEAAKHSGITLDRAFEKYIDAAFTILGYETKLLGQGQGRVPDGLAMAHDESYAVLWDAKVRADGYSMGTDDRTIREYIVTQSRELKRRRSMRNIYYAIVSSGFADDFDDAIRSIKMETDVNEVTLLEAEALVAMVDAKLRTPHQVTLGPDGLQRLFSSSGILSANTVREQLT